MIDSQPFDKFFDRLMDHEGGEVNDPNDPGGHTKYGISKRSYPDEDISGMTKKRAKEIFYRDFWRHIVGASNLDGVLWQLADFAYQSGPANAIRAFQRAIGVEDDGHFGPISKAAAASFTEADKIMLILAQRLDFMTGLRNWPHHGRGWARRLADNLRYGAADS